MWSSSDGAKYARHSASDANTAVTSAFVADGVSDLSTKEADEDGFSVGVFQYCTSMVSARLPRSLRKIGHHAFWDCKRLVRVDIPAGVSEIGDGAFCGCESLKSATIPAGVVDLPWSIFYQCKSLKSVKLPSSLRTIGKDAFAGCFSLTAVNFDSLKAVTKIGCSAFRDCSSLTTITLPPLLKTIEMCTFYECSSLSRVELPASLQVIKYRAFKNCRHPNLRIDLPEAAALDIGYEALQGVRVRLPESPNMLTVGGDISGLEGASELVVRGGSRTCGWLSSRLKSRASDLISALAPVLRLCDGKGDALHVIMSFLWGDSVPESIVKRNVAEVDRALGEEDGSGGGSGNRGEESFEMTKRRVKELERAVEKLQRENRRLKGRLEESSKESSKRRKMYAYTIK